MAFTSVNGLRVAIMRAIAQRGNPEGVDYGQASFAL
jgi:hypothetical protein